MNPWLALTIGIACAGLGGELFVRGLIGLAQWARVSAGIIATTVAAFATSSPELSVAMASALSGRPEISLGDALGSNGVNVALILALALCISGIVSPRATIRRDFPTAILVPFVVGGLGLDGIISRADGIALLVLFFVWLFLVVNAARSERCAVGPVLVRVKRGRMATATTFGLALLFASGHFIVQGARGVAVMFALPEFVTRCFFRAVRSRMSQPLPRNL